LNADFLAAELLAEIFAILADCFAEAEFFAILADYLNFEHADKIPTDLRVALKFLTSKFCLLIAPIKLVFKVF
jgi:hypothetical protein